MRHACIETTLRHYTDLRLTDQQRAVSKLGPILALPTVVAGKTFKATGTDGPSTAKV